MPNSRSSISRAANGLMARGDALAYGLNRVLKVSSLREGDLNPML